MSELVEVPCIHEVWDNAGAADVTLHPLTLMNITDHYSRLNLDAPPDSPPKRVVGLLLGAQTDKRTEVFTSFESTFVDDSGVITHSEGALDFIRKQREQFAKVFPTYDIVGWYITGSSLTADDVARTNALIRDNFCESPLILVLDTQPPSYVQTLPVCIFETVTRLERGGSGAATCAVRKIRYTVESEESERVGVDTAMQVDFLGEDNPTLVPTAQRLANAVNMLQQRIAVVLTYAREVRAGAIAPDYELLRNISSLCNQLPCADSPSFSASYAREFEDALLAVYMSLASKGTCFLSRLVEKSAVFAERRRPGAAFFGGAGGAM